MAPQPTQTFRQLQKQQLARPAAPTPVMPVLKQAPQAGPNISRAPTSGPMVSKNPMLGGMPQGAPLPHGGTVGNNPMLGGAGTGSKMTVVPAGGNLSPDQYHGPGWDPNTGAAPAKKHTGDIPQNVPLIPVGDPAPVDPMGQQLQQAYSSLGPMAQQTQQAIQNQITNPSRWDSQMAQDTYGRLNQTLTEGYDVQRQQLQEEMARRGLGDSTVYGGRLGDLGVQQARSQADLAQQVLEQQANTWSQDQNSAINNATGYQQQQLQNLLGYGQQGFENQMAVNSQNNQIDQNYWAQLLQQLGLS
jgi:hypothetical protein